MDQIDDDGRQQCLALLSAALLLAERADHSLLQAVDEMAKAQAALLLRGP